MRLVVLTTSYPLRPESPSGAFVARLVEHLPTVVSVAVVTPASHSNPTTTAAESRASIHTFRYAPRALQLLAHRPGGIPVALKTHAWMFMLLPGFLISMLFRCVYVARKANIIHANWAICGVIAGAAGKLLRVPVVTTLRGDDVTRAQRGMLDRWILALCLRLSTRVVCVSTAIATWIHEHYARHAKKVSVIENGVEDIFLRMPIERPAVPENAPLRFIAVGSLITRKNVELIIAALQKLNEKSRAILTIVGNGPERARLKAIARDCVDCRIEFEGELEPSAIPRALAKSHVFLLASHSEGRPNSVLEAMAAGLPVIASNIAGVDELVEHGVTGLLFTSGSAEELAQHMRTLLDNPSLRDRLGRAGRDAIVRRQLVWRETAAKYVGLYEATSVSR